MFEIKEQLFTSFKNKLISEKQLLSKNSFTFKNFISREAHFQFLCGLSVEEFNMLFEIVSPYTPMQSFIQTVLVMGKEL